MFSTDFKTSPYWWEQSPPQEQTLAPQNVPTAVDVLVVGAGYTGLHAALQTARGGMKTLLVDAQAPGAGCSTRNGGQISLAVKPSLDQLTRRFGTERGLAIRCAGPESMDFIADFIQSESIDCDYAKVGRFLGAHNQRQFDKLAQVVERPHSPGEEQDAYLVTKSELHQELGTDVYSGGAVFPHHASLDPGKYHAALLDKVQKAGATVAPFTPVHKIERTSAGFTAYTPDFVIKAKKVVAATNGYTDNALPWHRRRIIPIGSYVIATEELPKALIDRLFPTNRNICDTRKVIFYYRVSPDRKRIIFGGRVSLQETDARKSAVKLRAELVRLFPELETAKISHSWLGFVGFTFDRLMHTGEDDGLFYAMGYCGSGIGFASHLGMRSGLKVLGHKDGATAFDDLPFQTRPFYTGNPWFLAPSIMFYRLRDQYF